MYVYITWDFKTNWLTVVIMFVCVWRAGGGAGGGSIGWGLNICYLLVLLLVVLVLLLVEIVEK